MFWGKFLYLHIADKFILLGHSLFIYEVFFFFCNQEALTDLEVLPELSLPSYANMWHYKGAIDTKLLTFETVNTKCL